MGLSALDMAMPKDLSDELREMEHEPDVLSTSVGIYASHSFQT